MDGSVYTMWVCLSRSKLLMIKTVLCCFNCTFGAAQYSHIENLLFCCLWGILEGEGISIASYRKCNKEV